MKRKLVNTLVMTLSLAMVSGIASCGKSSESSSTVTPYTDSKESYLKAINASVNASSGTLAAEYYEEGVAEGLDVAYYSKDTAVDEQYYYDEDGTKVLENIYGFTFGETSCTSLRGKAYNTMKPDGENVYGDGVTKEKYADDFSKLLLEQSLLLYLTRDTNYLYTYATYEGEGVYTLTNVAIGTCPNATVKLSIYNGYVSELSVSDASGMIMKTVYTDFDNTTVPEFHEHDHDFEYPWDRICEGCEYVRFDYLDVAGKTFAKNTNYYLSRELTSSEDPYDYIRNGIAESITFDSEGNYEGKNYGRESAVGTYVQDHGTVTTTQSGALYSRTWYVSGDKLYENCTYSASDITVTYEYDEITSEGRPVWYDIENREFSFTGENLDTDTYGYTEDGLSAFKANYTESITFFNDGGQKALLKLCGIVLSLDTVEILGNRIYCTHTTEEDGETYYESYAFIYKDGTLYTEMAGYGGARFYTIGLVDTTGLN